MSDLIKRLRNPVYAKPTFPICARDAMLKAADELETLEAKDRRIAELNGLIAAATDLLVEQVETPNKFDLQWDRDVRLWLALAAAAKENDDG